MAMMSFSSMPGTKVASESNVQELQVAREAYELGCLISIASEDIEGFERHFALVKSCYTDYAGVLPASENQHQLQGLNLLGLLAQSKIGEFHTGCVTQNVGAGLRQRHHACLYFANACPLYPDACTSFCRISRARVGAYPCGPA
jgi:hypothetical protein